MPLIKLKSFSQSLKQLEQLFEIADSFNKNLDRTMLLSYIPGSILIGGVFFSA
ncbi:MAG: hypothetical protein QM487_06790 [Candidatus Marithrix sp.]